ncbi:hypothetical protein [Desulfobacca acetoxidans]
MRIQRRLERLEKLLSGNQITVGGEEAIAEAFRIFGKRVDGAEVSAEELDFERQVYGTPVLVTHMTHLLLEARL